MTGAYEDLLEQDKSVSIHTRNLQMLPTVMFKVSRNISPSIFSEIVYPRDINYNGLIQSLQCQILAYLILGSLL